MTLIAYYCMSEEADRCGLCGHPMAYHYVYMKDGDRTDLYIICNGCMKVYYPHGPKTHVPHVVHRV